MRHDTVQPDTVQAHPELHLSTLIARYLPALLLLVLALAVPASAQALGTPTGLQPTGTTYDSTPLFHWTSISGADRYRLAVKDTGGNWVYLPEPLPTSSPYIGSTLSVGCYTWEVRAETNGGVYGSWSTPKSFCVAALGTPTLSAPTGYTFDRTPTFSWSAVSGANYYRLTVKDSSNTVVYSPEPLPTGTSYTHGSALYTGCYTWNVRAEISIGDYGPWSSTGSFCIADMPGSTTQVGPSGPTGDDTPLFLWYPISGVNYYRLQVRYASSGTPALSPDPTPASSHYLTPPADAFDDNTCYDWRVRGELDAGAGGPWTNWKEFCIDLSLLRTAPLAPGAALDAAMAWEIEDVDGWHSRVATGAAEALARSGNGALVARPGRLPAALDGGSFGRDAAGRERRTLALIGDDRDEADLLADPRTDLRSRAPAIFRVERADGEPLTDADLYPTADHGYVPLRLVAAEPGSFEAFVREQYKAYLRSLIEASLDGSVSQITAWRVAEPADGVIVHPAVHARHLRELATIFDELAAETPWIEFGRTILLGAEDRAPRGTDGDLPTH